jgi:hypothetical protein
MATRLPLNRDSTNSNQRNVDDGPDSHRDLRRLPALGLKSSTRVS